MKLLLVGHDDRYAIEQLQLALFPDETMEPAGEAFSGDGAVSALHAGKRWLTATARITLHGVTERASRRMKLEEAMDRWMYLQEKWERISQQKGDKV